MSLDLAEPLRAACLAAAGIGDALAAYKDTRPIFTRRPLPADAPALAIAISPDVAIGDQDYLNSLLPIVQRDIAVYGAQPADYRAVEQIAYRIRDLFHQNKWAIAPDGYDVINIIANGPIPGPTDDQATVARVVGLTLQLRKQQ